MKNEPTSQQIMDYLKKHWIALVLGAIPATLVAIFTLINTFINFELNYDELRTTVSANAVVTHSLESELQEGQITEQTNLTKILQQQQDQQKQLTQTSNQINTLYNYILGKPRS